jgi:hypothetical protein
MVFELALELELQQVPGSQMEHRHHLLGLEPEL